ncbi:winged helix-turn-helix transcriptional regulator [Gordonia rhizosphera]|uniref:Putative HxlR family transcriptional regulator n=1 Tax=Gordonia rhizosphera NBRC 16068 TaxID=1108045 RepID=K6WEZ5_9ACTN|nr:helix-turn-helix domain-containing protein [Gordonia rhizosphera]GAB90762.1 putative HxlR family transcriptional regulator [Gordonia rhizosphera NBRC 16068]
MSGKETLEADGSEATASDSERAARSGAAADRIAARADRLVEIEDLCDGAGSIRSALATVGGVWAMSVLIALRQGPMRYSELKRRVAGINDRMLSQTLQRFERDGLVERRPISVSSSREEYVLTDIGIEICTAVSEFVFVVMKLAPRVAVARTKFDAAE